MCLTRKVKSGSASKGQLGEGRSQQGALLLQRAAGADYNIRFDAHRDGLQDALSGAAAGHLLAASVLGGHFWRPVLAHAMTERSSLFATLLSTR